MARGRDRPGRGVREGHPRGARGHSRRAKARPCVARAPAARTVGGRVRRASDGSAARRRRGSGMSDIDVSVVVTAHDEIAVSGPTMRSADLAVAEATRRGHMVETIVALDKPTPATSEYFYQPRFDHWERWELH